MDDLQSQLGSILENPQMMQQIMSITQTLQTPANPPEAPTEPTADFDMATIQKMASFLGKTGIDTQQKALLQALHPYLSNQRIAKLEKAMRAAKLAGMATAFFNTAGR